MHATKKILAFVAASCALFLEVNALPGFSAFKNSTTTFTNSTLVRRREGIPLSNVSTSPTVAAVPVPTTSLILAQTCPPCICTPATVTVTITAPCVTTSGPVVASSSPAPIRATTTQSPAPVVLVQTTSSIISPKVAASSVPVVSPSVHTTTTATTPSIPTLPPALTRETTGLTTTTQHTTVSPATSPVILFAPTTLTTRTTPITVVTSPTTSPTIQVRPATTLTSRTTPVIRTAIITATAPAATRGATTTPVPIIRRGPLPNSARRVVYYGDMGLGAH